MNSVFFLYPLYICIVCVLLLTVDIEYPVFSNYRYIVDKFDRIIYQFRINRYKELGIFGLLERKKHQSSIY